MKSGKEGRFTRVAAFRFVLPLQPSSLFLFLFGGACSYASWFIFGVQFSPLGKRPSFYSPLFYFCFICLSPSCFSLVIRSSPLTSVASPVLPSVGFFPFFFVFHRCSAPFVRSVLALGAPLFPSALSREESSFLLGASERPRERGRARARQTHTRTTCVFPFASARASPLPPLRSLVRIVVVGRPASAATAATTRTTSTAVFRCAVLGWVVTAAAVSSLPRAAPPTRPRRRRRRDGLCRLASPASASLLGRARAASRR